MSSKTKEYDELENEYIKLINDPLSKWRIDNIVILCRLCHISDETKPHRISLAAVVESYGNKVSCNSKKFANVPIKYTNPKTVNLLYAKGKIVCTAAKNEDRAIQILRQQVDYLRENIYSDIKIKEYTIQNIVGSSRIGFEIDRYKLFSENMRICSFGNFPGVIIRPPELRYLGGKKPKRITGLIFETGAINITGAQSLKDAENAFLLIFDIVKKYIKFDIKPTIINTKTKKRKNIQTKKAEYLNSIIKNNESISKKSKIENNEEDNDHSKISLEGIAPIQQSILIQEEISTKTKYKEYQPLKRSIITKVVNNRPHEKIISCKECSSSLCTEMEEKVRICCFCIHLVNKSIIMCRHCLRTEMLFLDPTKRI